MKLSEKQRNYVPNKYNIKPDDITRAKVLKPECLKEKPFWRNDVVYAYCLSGRVVPNPKDHKGTFDLSYWIGFYDEKSPEHAGEIRYHCTSMGDMCSYNFKSFYNEEEIENEDDLKLQQKFLSRINWLLDEGIIEIEN